MGKNTKLGIISLIFSMIGIWGATLGDAFLGLRISGPYGFILVLSVAIFGFIAIPLGIIAYKSKEKDKLGLLGAIVGVISLILNGIFAIVAILSLVD